MDVLQNGVDSVGFVQVVDGKHGTSLKKLKPGALAPGCIITVGRTPKTVRFF